MRRPVLFVSGEMTDEQLCVRSGRQNAVCNRQWCEEGIISLDSPNAGLFLRNPNGSLQ